MLDDFLNSIRVNLFDRATSPLFGSFAISWLVWNYKLVLLTFSGMGVVDKFVYIDSVLYSSWSCQGLMYLLILPLATSLSYIYLYPIPAYYIFRYSREKKNRLKNLKNELDGKVLLTKEQSKKIKDDALKAVIDAERKIEVVTEKYESVRNDLERIEIENGDLLNKLTESQKLVSAGEKVSVDPQIIQAAILEHPYILHYNYNNLGWKKKVFQFSPGGDIVEGKGHSENSWRIKEGHFEFITKDGDTHSRFNFYPISDVFINTNDPDTLSSKGQYLIPQRDEYKAPDASVNN